MKVAISVPDSLFDAAELVAMNLRLSRSSLYAQALEEFLAKRSAASITSQLNAVYAQESSDVDVEVNAAQLKSVHNEAW
jgi:metal-responsive CopG/Arc/MetJ family transcriptional regulator